MAVEDHFVGVKPLTVQRGQGLHCDVCRDEISTGEEVSCYWCNVDYGPFDIDGETVYRVYCSECDRKTIQFPAKDATELLIAARLDESYAFEDVSVLDKSQEGRGVKWQPPGMFKIFVGETPEEYLDNEKIRVFGAFGPEDAYDFFGQFGLDVSEVVNDDGQVVKTEAELAMLRRRFFESLEEELENRAEG